jgi:hypothetical protein
LVLSSCFEERRAFWLLAWKEIKCLAKNHAFQLAALVFS